MHFKILNFFFKVSIQNLDKNLTEALTVTMNWRDSSSQMCSEHSAALVAAGLARGQRTAVLDHTAYCSHTESGSGPAGPPSACA